MFGRWSLYLVVGLVALAVYLIKEGQENLFEKRHGAFIFDMIALAIVVGLIGLLAGSAWGGLKGFL